MKAERFGYKNAWVAIRSGNHAAIVDGLPLRDLRPADWASGIAAAYENPFGPSVFMTPPIDGWTLVVGCPFLRAADGSPPVLDELVASWAQAIGCEVQFYVTHRGVEAHGWARATPGGSVRAFVYEAGQGVVLEVGERTPEERAAKALKRPTEDHVMDLAAKWSVDPSVLDQRELEVGPGFLASFGDAPPPEPTPPEPLLVKPWWQFW